MYYLFLTLAIVLELIATTLLKYTEGFTKPGYTVSCMIMYFLCYFTFSKAINGINLGIAYATWCGVGIVVTAVLSAVLFDQGLSLLGVLGIVLIIAGCVILNLFGSAS